MIKGVLLGILIVVNISLILLCYIILVKWVKKTQRLEKKIFHLQKLVRGLQVADMRFNRKVDILQHEAEQLASVNEATVDLDDHKEDKYRYALKLLQMGMSIEDVVETCELGRAEAELLQSLEGYKKFKKSQ